MDINKLTEILTKMNAVHEKAADMLVESANESCRGNFDKCEKMITDSHNYFSSNWADLEKELNEALGK